MKTQLEKKYGLITAIAMVVGIVIGSGVFFKAEKVLSATGGNLKLGILAWVVGGLIMISCAYTFSVMATRYEYVNGVVDYAEAAVGEKYGYYVGWFMAIIYYPTLTAVLAWVSARYTCVLLGFSITGGECMTIACLYLVGSYALNALSPVMAGKFQVTTTVIKLIPLALMALVGTVVGITNGMIIDNFTTVVEEVSTSNALFTAVVATAFAYEGWIIATSINAELKDAKKNLPLALVSGTFIIMIVYILYYVGLAGAVSNETMMVGGEAGAKLAFQTIFSEIGGTLIFGLLLCGICLLYFYGANLTAPWFGFFSFDSSELPIVTIYALYVPIFIMIMKKEKDLSTFNRYIMPSMALLGCLFMIIAAWFSHGMAVVAYLIIFALVMVLGAMVIGNKSKEDEELLKKSV